MVDSDPVACREIFSRIEGNIGGVMRGQREAVRILLAAFAGGGHVLIEDSPGTGKTTLAKALARSVDAGYARIQFTPDLLPSDILGVSVYDQERRAFRFHEGPVFTNILLADEINRASPRTQSALLEVMAEAQVSVDGRRLALPDLFFTIATQNPVETSGTYALPEAQMDRFALRFSLGYVSLEEEMGILEAQRGSHPLEGVRPVVGMEEVARLKAGVREVAVTEEIRRYIVSLARATRKAPGVKLGASPRASLALMKTSQALALYDGLPFVTPDHVQELAVSVIAHRLMIDPQARFSGTTAEAVVTEILTEIPVPA